MTLRTVKHDIFPRFRQSAHFDQLLYVHLGRTLQHDGFRALFEAELTPMQHNALAFLRDARALSERAEADEEETGAAARRASLVLLSQHGDQLTQLCADEYDATKQALDVAEGATEGSAPGDGSVLGSLVHACQNQLVEPYVAFLASEKSQLLLKELGVASIDLSSRSDGRRLAPEASVATVDCDPDDWAAGL